jgi:DNA polymerase-3 subunit chi
MTGACQVDFYVLEDESLSPELLVCRLALMAWEQGNRIIVLVENEAQAKQLDNLMWENPPGRFLPHGVMPQPGFAPVRIVAAHELKKDAAEVVINLTREAVSSPERFQRLLELVPYNDAQRQASREKFRAYRNRGLKPESHTINRT